MAKGYKLPRQARKESAGSITIEPLTKSAPHSEEITPPTKPGQVGGDGTTRISPEPKAGQGWKAQPAIEHPGDVQHRSDLDKT